MLRGRIEWEPCFPFRRDVCWLRDSGIPTYLAKVEKHRLPRAQAFSSKRSKVRALLAFLHGLCHWSCLSLWISLAAFGPPQSSWKPWDFLLMLSRSIKLTSAKFPSGTGVLQYTLETLDLHGLMGGSGISANPKGTFTHA